MQTFVHVGGQQFAIYERGSRLTSQSAYEIATGYRLRISVSR